ncbi:MAG: transglutaminase-like domain-containing protein [Alicyclobacillus sp.]|nr:transglutaminase-like domain-containing protein [Alicyclobacillus sp.]
MPFAPARWFLQSLMVVSLSGGALSSSLVTVPAVAAATLAVNPLATTSGYYINGVFYNSSDVAHSQAELLALNQALAQAGVAALYLMLNGEVANYQAFMQQVSSSDNLVNQFLAYAQQHPFTLPAATVLARPDGSQVPYYQTSDPSVTSTGSGTLSSGTGSSTSGAGGTAVTASSSGGGTSGSAVGGGGSGSTAGAGGLNLPALADSVQLPSVGQAVSNGAQDDSVDWQRMSEDFYIMAQTTPIASTTSTPPLLLALQPGQTVYLAAYKENAAVPPRACQWTVNSAQARVTPQMAGATYTLNGYTVAAAQFVAQSPGIYTVQAYANGEYSVPLVLVVGLNALTGSAPLAAATDSGVVPLPAGWQPGALVTGTYFDYTVGSPVNGWLPVTGKAHTPGGQVSVVLSSGGQSWLYTVPEQADGSFAACLRSPYTGSVNVGFVPNLFQQLNQNSSYQWADATTVTVPEVAPTLQHQALFASAMRDYNVQAPYAATAAKLAAAAPTLDTAIAAISNVVSETVAYNFTAANNNQVPWQDAATTWNTRLGVCQDMANLAAAMLATLGVPVQTLTGTANNGAQTESHEWDQAWDGRNWLIFDPTWGAPDDGPIDTLVNEFFTDTVSLQASHQWSAGGTGTAFAPVVGVPGPDKPGQFRKTEALVGQPALAAPWAVSARREEEGT